MPEAKLIMPAMTTTFTCNLFIALWITLVGQNSSFPATVIAVKDGDSLVVSKGDEKIQIRLEGIDCPELSQPFGQEAQQTTSRLAKGKAVMVQATGKDRYGRTLANLVLPNDTSLNQELLRQGRAWWFRKYSNDQTLAKLEADARKNKRGLWADANPTAPWDWREMRRTKGRQPLVNVKVAPNGVEIVAMLPNPQGQDPGREEVVIGNSTETAVDLSGWSLKDRAGNVYALFGIAPAKERLAVKMTAPTMPLNNNGDEVLLIDGGGVVRSQVTYGEDDVGSGKWLQFAVADR